MKIQPTNQPTNHQYPAVLTCFLYLLLFSEGVGK